jgi:hypothetical protein
VFKCFEEQNEFNIWGPSKFRQTAQSSSKHPKHSKHLIVIITMSKQEQVLIIEPANELTFVGKIF